MLSPEQVAKLLRAIETRRAERERERLRMRLRRASMDVETRREQDRRYQRAKRARDAEARS